MSLSLSLKNKDDNFFALVFKIPKLSLKGEYVNFEQGFKRLMYVMEVLKLTLAVNC